MTEDKKKTDQPVMHIVGYTSGSGDLDGFTYTVIPMTLEYTLWLLKLIGLTEAFAVIEEASFHRVTYFHYAPRYYASWDDCYEDGESLSHDELQGLEELIDGGEWVEMPEGYEPPDEKHGGRTTCDTLGVDASSVIYNAYPKHTSEQLEPPVLTKFDLSQIANTLMERYAKQEAKKTGHGRERVIQLDPHAEPAT